MYYRNRCDIRVVLRSKIGDAPSPKRRCCRLRSKPATRCRRSPSEAVHPCTAFGTTATTSCCRTCPVSIENLCIFCTVFSAQISPDNIIAPHMDFDIPHGTVCSVIIPVLQQTIFLNDAEYLLIGIEPLAVLLAIGDGVDSLSVLSNIKVRYRKTAF